MLVLARDEGLPFVDIVTDDDNVASQAVVRANGGLLEEEFVTPPSSGSHPALRFRVLLNAGLPPALLTPISRFDPASGSVLQSWPSIGAFSAN